MSFDSAPSPGPSWGLVLVRVVVGLLLLQAGWDAVAGGVGAELVLGWQASIETSPSVLRGVGENLLLKHPWFFAKLLAYGTLLGGVALFLGALTRPFGLLCALLQLMLWCYAADSGRALALLTGTAALGCALSRAGSKFGADVFLDERLPGWLTWSRGGGG